MTSLHKLVKDPDATLQALIAGADPDERDRLGNTPLHAAVWPAELEVVRSLLAFGADVNARNRRGVPVLHEAVRRRKAAMAVLLAETGAAVDDHAADDGSTPLHWAAKAGDVELLHFLLERGAAIDAVDDTGRTPLQWVLPRADSSLPDLGGVVRALLSAGAAHSLEDAVGWGPEEVVRRWLARGTPPGAKLGDGGSLLGLAAERGDPAVVRLLLEAGARPDGERFDARSPLLRAVAAQRAEAVETLLRAGAHPEHGGAGGGLPLDEEVERSRVTSSWTSGPCGVLLLAYGARPTPQWAVVCDDPEVLRRALECGWEVDRAGKRGHTALILATDANRPGMVEALLRAGADVDAADDAGQTALHAAAETWRARTEIARLLLAAGADPDARDHGGSTPLHLALRRLRSSGVSIEMVEILVAGGADPEIRNEAGATPFEVDLPGHLDVDVRDDGAEVARRRDAAVAKVEEILETASPRRTAPRVLEDLRSMALRRWKRR